MCTYFQRIPQIPHEGRSALRLSMGAPLFEKYGSGAFQRYMTTHILLYIGMLYTIRKLMN